LELIDFTSFAVIVHSENSLLKNGKQKNLKQELGIKKHHQLLLDFLVTDKVLQENYCV